MPAIDLDGANKLRKKLTEIDKKIGKLSKEKVELTRQIETIENSCNHQWERRKYEEELNKFTRRCEFCGRVEVSRAVKPDF